MEYLQVVNWEKYQHYKHRDPLWVKLYHRLLDDYDYTQLSIQDRCLLLQMYMLAAKFSNMVPKDVQWIKNKLSWTGKMNFTTLIDKGFLRCYQDDSKLLCNVYQSAPRYVSVSVYWKENNLEEHFANFKKMRRQIRKPLNEVAERRLIARHKRLVEEGHDPIELLELATERCWLSLYPPKDSTNETNQRTGRSGQRHETPAARQARLGREHLARLSGNDGRTMADDVGPLWSSLDKPKG